MIYQAQAPAAVAHDPSLKLDAESQTTALLLEIPSIEFGEPQIEWKKFKYRGFNIAFGIKHTLDECGDDEKHLLLNCDGKSVSHVFMTTNTLFSRFMQAAEQWDFNTLQFKAAMCEALDMHIHALAAQDPGTPELHFDPVLADEVAFDKGTGAKSVFKVRVVLDSSQSMGALDLYDQLVGIEFGDWNIDPAVAEVAIWIDHHDERAQSAVLDVTCLCRKLEHLQDALRIFCERESVSATVCDSDGCVLWQTIDAAK
jgi:hypothetical protein